jgi:hypothetical protein
MIADRLGGGLLTQLHIRNEATNCSLHCGGEGYGEEVVGVVPGLVGGEVG